MSHWKDFLDPEARGGRYLAWKEVARATGLSRTTAWRLQKRGEFPAPYVISPGRVGYREGEVEAWRVSRDLRGPGARSRPDPPQPPAFAVSPASEAAKRSSHPTASFDPAPPMSSPSTPSRPTLSTPPPRVTTTRSHGATPAQPPKPVRRSEHARAIAQQIKFDF